ncbi:hypothetical protein LSCM1_02755 [Leishmania martiniquensis]|uniref:Uncharacterized protein n=1 Tax=Leishmania martiniquensis TaxID=1580590 RepID=A0A836GKU1_9TRYP|nr:hypothetical protein LSCM1_02755 [Leishmania martiniquensis]
MHASDEAKTKSGARFGAQNQGGDMPSWLRRSYTRTISSEIRTTEQLQCSFEDVRKQWWGLCLTYTQRREESSCHGKVATEEILPRGTRDAVDRLVSQLKSVKQELLAHLSRLSGALAVPTIPPPSEAASSPLPAWVSDLMGDSIPCNARASRVEQNSEAIQSYLQAIWLARRVWAWSLCFATVTMDLELLSSSVSVAAELFFGNLCRAATATEGSKGVRDWGDDAALHSAYNLNGVLSEALLHATVAAVAARVSLERRAENGVACWHDAHVPMQILAKVEEEGREIAAFFGCSVASAMYTAGSVGGASSMPVDPHAATPEGDVPVPMPETSAAPAIRDMFWVNAVALCYGVVVRDDANAARLLSVFEAAKRSFSAEATEGALEEESASSSPSIGAPEQPRASETPSVIQSATVFVLLVAKLLIDEDYGALPELLRRAGFVDEGDDCAADGEVLCPSLLLAAGCPEGAVLRFLIRLLAEHVVRRRWIEHGLGQAFRPIEPHHAGADAATVEPDRLEDAERHQGAYALANRMPLDEAARRARLNRQAAAWKLFPGTRDLCHALQMAALRSIRGEWPLPPALLRSAFS